MSQFAFSIFQEKRKYKTGLLLFLCRPKPVKTGSVPLLCAALGRTQAATWPWAGKVPRPHAPAWAGDGPIMLHRRITSVGHPQASRGQNHARPRRLETLASFGSRPFSLFALSLLSSHSSEASGDLADAASERAAMAPSPAPSPACALPSG